MPELEPRQLRRRCDPARFEFTTTAELADLEEDLGQARAAEAVELGVALAQEGFNLFVFGPQGSGRHSLVRRALGRAAAARPSPDAWVYVANFADEQRPRALRLPAGRGAALCRDMAELVEELQTALPLAFESDDYLTRREVLEEEFKERQEHGFGELGRRAEERGLVMMRTPLGVAFAPARQGSVMTPQEFEALAEAERHRLEAEVVELKAALEKLLHQLPRWQRERRERVRQLHREVARFAVGAQIAELEERYRDLPAVAAYLAEVETDVVRHAHAFVATDAAKSDDGGTSASGAPLSFRRYQVNLMVDPGADAQAPVVEEDNPTFRNLCGTIEHVSQLGTLVTDFTLIRPGALHRANGGYLMLDALQLLRQPFAWEALKRALRSRQLRVEPLGQALALLSTASLEPEGVPLEVKIVLVGEPHLYYLLAAYDPDVAELFKVVAELDDRLPWDDDHEPRFARLVATLARRAELAPLDPAAVARAVEEAARAAGDARWLSLHTAGLTDLLCEADLWRARAGRAATAAADVESALAARERRTDRIRRRLLEETLRGTLRVTTAGALVGQVNGLSVYQLGGYLFGRPSRITARARLGEGEVLNIEREVELSGPIHSKGVLILSGFLGERYAAERPLSLAASLVFEQSYGGVEGDSASLAELCALLSAIAGLPLRQDLAVTGSVDQRGEVQSVGGVDEKIEGFFELCAARGLAGGEGVLVPATDVDRLMLRREVVEAVAAGVFHVWAVASVDQAMELLTGLPAGERGEDGLFPPATVNAAVEGRLALLAERRRAFTAGAREEVTEVVALGAPTAAGEGESGE